MPLGSTYYEIWWIQRCLLCPAPKQEGGRPQRPSDGSAASCFLAAVVSEISKMHADHFHVNTRRDDVPRPGFSGGFRFFLPAIVLVTECAFYRNCLSPVHRFCWGWLASRPREAARSRGNLLSGPQSLILTWAHGPQRSFKASLGATAELLGTLDFLIVKRIKTNPASGHLVTLWRKHLEETRQECFLFWI